MIAIWFSYLIFLTIREELTGSALNRKRPSGVGRLLPQSPAPLAEPTPPLLALKPPSGTQQDEDLVQAPSELPFLLFEGLDLDDFKTAYASFEKTNAELLGLPPGTKVYLNGPLWKQRGKRRDT